MPNHKGRNLCLPDPGIAPLYPRLVRVKFLFARQTEGIGGLSNVLF